MVLPSAVYGCSLGLRFGADDARAGFLPWALTLAYAIAAQTFAVFVNDLADEAADRANRDWNWFSGGSRVLPDGRLNRTQLRVGAIGAATVLAALCFPLARPERAALSAWGETLVALAALTAGCIGSAVVYSRPPFRAGARGYGASLQAFGTGLVLPLVGYLAVGGALPPASVWAGFFPTIVLGFAANVLTALPDVHADRAVRKSTIPVRLGERPARVLGWALCVLAAGGFVAMAWPMSPRLLLSVTVMAAGSIALLGLVLLPRADATSRPACAGFVVASLAAPTVAQIAATWSLATSD
jgi:4-hydroxybenzoate polyprenyltransferase